MQKQKLYVVEGLHDEAHLKQLYKNIQTISVGGSAISQEVIDFLVAHQETFEINLLFDPDFPGEKIRKKVTEKLTHYTHIFVNKEDAKHKRKVGIEHVSKDKLDEAMNHGIHVLETQTLSYKDFLDFGFSGNNNSKIIRREVCEKLHLGFCNAKILYQRLNMIGITKQNLKDILDEPSI
jgi:ribonuclease M5